MKKLSLRHRELLIRRARAGTKGKAKRVRHHAMVTAWHGDTSEIMISRARPLNPPRIMCFDENPDETIAELARWRNKFTSALGASQGRFSWVNRPKRGLAWVKTYIDYSRLEDVSTAASVVIAAEYARARELIGETPPAINLHLWNPAAFHKLFGMGFFEIVGLSPNVSERFNQKGDVKTMRIVSGHDSAELAKVGGQISELAEFIDRTGPEQTELLIALNTALSEAMSNVTKWAYPSDHPFRHKHVARWWVAATADRRNRSLTVVMYDQGASIPVMFPRKSGRQAVIDRVRGTFWPGVQFALMHDGDYIAEAMKMGKTTTDKKWHGKGLPQMMDLVDLFAGGSLTILSRGGECRYDRRDQLVSLSRPVSIGGTLIEWKLSLPSGEKDG